MRDDLLKLKNIGEKTVDWLIDVGITTPQHVEELGAVEVYRRLQTKYPVTSNAFWALQGALMDLPYNKLPDDAKQNLLQELENRATSDDATGL